MAEMALARQVIEEALKAGAEAAEAFLLRSRTTTIDVKNGVVDTFIVASEEGIGLRLLVEGGLGFAYSSDLQDQALRPMVEEAIRGARGSAQDPYHAFPKPFPSYPEVRAYDPHLQAIPVSEKIERARALEQAAKGFDRRITKIRHAAYRDLDFTAFIVNSFGLEVTFSGTFCSALTYVVAEEDGEAETGFEFDFGRAFHDLRVEEVGRRAAERAVRKLGAKAIPTGKSDVLLDSAVASEFLGVLALSLTAESVHKQKSLLAGRIGQRIGSEKVHIVDNGRDPRGMFLAPCDGEGVPSQRTLLVEAGILRGYLYDSYWAAKDGTASTGNARRMSFKTPPELGPSNLFFEPGLSSPEVLLQKLGRGLYVVSALGMHTANPISGDFSIGVEGFWVEGGKIAFPVRGVTLAGNVLTLLEKVAEVGADLRFYGRTGSPTLLIRDLDIGGL